jgi:hypothetical protein
MSIKCKKLFTFSVIFASALLSLDSAYTRAEPRPDHPAQAPDISALIARNARRGRSPAFVPERPRPAAGAETALLAEAAQAASAVEAAAFYGAAWRLNPTKARAAELRRAFARAHPGAELSDFVALKVADL